MPTPAILLFFANDRGDGSAYLRNLPDEARRVLHALEPAERAGLCEVVLRQNVILSDVLNVLQNERYRDRIAILHFGGHSASYRLLLESEKGYPETIFAGGLTRLLGNQRGLQLVFLNGCSTQPFVEGLLGAGVPCAVSTSQAIDDLQATLLAERFYKGLAAGATIRRAFDEAAADRRAVKGDNPRDFFRHQTAAEDRFPWTLEPKRGRESAADTTLPDLAGNPLFGLPAPPENPSLPDKPFRHLQWFRSEEAELFFGREFEIRDLYVRLTSPNSDPITLLYGESGVGKSSLLAAGLIPRLRQTHEVRYLRRGSLELPLILETKKLWLGDALKELSSPAKPLILVLDQVENEFTKSGKSDCRVFERFLCDLRSALDTSTDGALAKVVLGFRKEWLPDVDSLLKETGLARGYVHLKPLDRRGIVRAIRGPARLFGPDGVAIDNTELSLRLFKKYRLEIQSDLPDEIAHDLLGLQEGLAIAPILQILLTKMWDAAWSRNPASPRFDRKLYLRLRNDGILLKDFLRNQFTALQLWRPEVVDSGLALDVLRSLTTSLGTAKSRPQAEVEQEYAHRADVLNDLIEQCKTMYLVGQPANPEPGTGGELITLAHDTLAPLVREMFDTSDLPGQRAARVMQSSFPEFVKDRKTVRLSERDLLQVRVGRRGMRVLTTSEMEFCALSEKHVANRRRVFSWIRRAAIAFACFSVFASIIATVLYVKEAHTSRELASTNGRLVKSLHASDLARASDYFNNAVFYRDFTNEPLRAAHGFARSRFYFARGANTPRSEEALLALNNLLTRPDSIRATAVGPLSSVYAWSKDGTRLLAGIDDVASLWDCAAGKILFPFQHHGQVKGAKFSADESHVVSWDDAGDVAVWQSSSGRRIGGFTHKGGAGGAAFSGDGARVLSWGADGRAAVWQVSPGGEVATVRHDGGVTGARFSTDESRILSWGNDQLVKVSSGDTGKLVFSFKHSGGVSGAVFDPRGRRVLSWGVGNIGVVWEPDSRKVVRAYRREAWVNGGKFSQNGERILLYDADGEVAVFDVSTATQVGGFKHSTWASGAVFDRSVAKSSVGRETGMPLCGTSEWAEYASSSIKEESAAPRLTSPSHAS
jgi:WD40 repeat protein